MIIQKNREDLFKRIQEDSFFFKSTKPMLVLPMVTTIGCMLPISLVSIDYSIDNKINGPVGLTLLALVSLIWMIYIWIFFFTKMKEKKEFNKAALEKVKKMILDSVELSDYELELNINNYLLQITAERTAKLRAKEGKLPLRNNR